MEINNREIAILAWLAIFIVILALYKNIRRSFGAVLRVLCHRIMLSVLGIAILWIVGSVALLSTISLWGWGNINTTVLWAISFALVTLFDIGRINEDKIFFGKMVRDILSVTAMIGFVADFYTFSIWIELLLVPVLTILSLMQVVGGKKPEFALVNKLIGRMLILAGLSYLTYGVVRMILQFWEFATMESLREFASPVLLSLMFLPFIYGLSVYMAYEINFVRLDLWIGDDKLRIYAKRKALLEFGLNLSLLRRWSLGMMRVRSTNEAQIRSSISDVKARRKRELARPIIPPKDGWSPYLARKFLAAEGLTTDDYDPMYADQWGASSKMIKIGDHGFFDHITYMIEGDVYAAKRLTLMLNVSNQEDSKISEENFQRVAHILLATALGVAPSDTLITRLSGQKPFDIEEAGRQIRITRKDFAGVTQSYERILTIDFAPNYQPP